MNKIVECVPNFSEGKDTEKINRIMDTLRKKEGVSVVNVESDADYNRTVVTLIGDPEAIMSALIGFVKICIDEIDLNHHVGEHSRMGAVDVIPFIPIQDVTMKECVDYANQLGEKISKLFAIPVFLYAEAAKFEERILLPNIRKGEFEGMKEKIKNPLWVPDFGKPEIHPTFGCVAVGAREFLVAFNIDLATLDEKIASNISKTIRKSNGGFQYIQAGPATLEKRGHVQVTMNILDYKKNPVYRIFETVKMEALRYHIDVPSTEIIGLLPKNALLKSLEYYFQCDNISLSKDISVEDIVRYSKEYLRIRDFDSSKIIETYL